MNNATLVAILTKAKSFLWTGGLDAYGYYKDGTDKFMCIAVDRAALAVVPDYATEKMAANALKDRIIASIDRHFTFEGYFAAKKGVTVEVLLEDIDYVEVQTARHAILDKLIAEYQAKIDTANAKIKTLSLAAERWEERTGSPYICDNLNHVEGGYFNKDAIKEDIRQYIGHKFCIVTWLTGDDEGLDQWDLRVVAERRKMIATLLARYEAEAA